MNTTNRQILLASRPQGMPTEANFKLVETIIPQPRAGEVLVRTLYLSVDPNHPGFRKGDIVSGMLVWSMPHKRF